MGAADREQLQALFRQELDELGVALNRGLVALEAETGAAARRALVTDLFRHAHTLKGAAQSAGMRHIASLCHELEDRFEALRTQPADARAEPMAPLFQLVDAITAGGRELGDASPPASSPPSAADVEADVERDPGADIPGRPGDGGTSGTLRLPPAKLDALLDDAHEVLLAEQILAELLTTDDRLHRDVLRRAGRRVRQSAARLEGSARALRLAPFQYACDGLERLARDVASAAGKSVQLEVRGGDVELDRPILDRLREPLGHLVRNAVDHGIESPSERARSGKPAQGRLAVTATLRGGRVQVELRDDGAGIDTTAVRSRARAVGLALPEDQIESALFSPGFSTAAKITATSGRGVGLDAVRDVVESLGGAIELDSRLRRGVTVRMVLPLTLSALRVVVVEAAGSRFGLASAAIDRLAILDAASVATVEGRARVLTDAGPVPLVPLAGLLGLPAAETSARFPIAFATSGGQQVALQVDRLAAEMEVTLRTLGDRLTGVRAVLGGAILPDGPVVVLSPTAAARLGLTSEHPARLSLPEPPSRRLHVLLADDSMTTRTLERAILEGAGYTVTTAADGMEALELASGDRFDVVVSDVAMPRMDGVTLCERLRASSRHGDVPIVLVTSRASEEDRLRGLQAGASAYLTKQAFDQGDLLDTIDRLAGAP